MTKKKQQKNRMEKAKKKDVYLYINGMNAFYVSAKGSIFIHVNTNIFE